MRFDTIRKNIVGIVLAGTVTSSSLAVRAQADVTAEPAKATMTERVPEATTDTTNVVNRRPISLPECYDLALKENLALRILRLAPQSSLYDLQIAWAGYEPNLTLSGGHSYSVFGGGFNPSIGNIPSTRTDSDTLRGGFSGLGPFGLGYSLGGSVNADNIAPNGDSARGGVSIALSQPLLKNLWIDPVRYSIAVTRKSLQISELRLQDQIITILTGVEQAYYDLVFAREFVGVQRQGLELAQRQALEDKKRVEIGTLARLEEKQSESAVAARQSDLSEARRLFATAQNRLKRLITSNYRDLHDAQLDPTDALVPEPHVPDLQESWRRALAQRPDVLEARANLERQGITVRYLNNQRLPELDITGGYGHGSSGNTVREFSDAFGDFRTGRQPNWNIGAALSMPLTTKAARARYRQGKLAQEELQLALKQQEETALVEVDEAVHQLRTNFDLMQSTREARIYAQEALEAEQTKLQAGRSTSFVVLRLQNDLTAARANELRAQANYKKSLADLFRAEGSTLQRRNITLEVK